MGTPPRKEALADLGPGFADGDEHALEIAAGR
jgi:hypothetical protein